MYKLKLYHILSVLLIILFLPFGGLAQLIGKQYCESPTRISLEQGFKSGRVGFTTSDRFTVGLLCFETPERPDMPIQHKYQHPTWSDAGYLGPLITDEHGNLITAPAPRINTLYNLPEKQNSIFLVNSHTGVMSEVFRLPGEKKGEEQNPYGILGMTYDCDTKLLYVGTVYESGRENEVGKIFVLKNIQTSPEIIDVLEGIDPFGICVAEIGAEKILFCGSARKSRVLAISLTEDGRFQGSPQYIINIEGLGPRGDDKARKIQVRDNRLLVWCMPFYYNLVAPSKKADTLYVFYYHPETRKWRLESAR